MNDHENYLNEEQFSTIIKNLELRWGLTLASFLPENAQALISNLQAEVSNRFDKCSKYNNAFGGFSFYFYSASNLHCTHFTLKRSNPCSPIKRADFLKPGIGLYELFKRINNVACEVNPFHGILDRFKVKQNGIELILFGQCLHKQDVENRSNLLRKLNESLLNSFNLDIRRFDSDPTQFHKLHCCIGYLKRPQTVDLKKLEDVIESLNILPVTLKIDSIQLIHHRHRSLAFPQEGIFTFPLGKTASVSEEEFLRRINLI